MGMISDLRALFYGFYDSTREETEPSYKTTANGRSTDKDYVIAPGSCSNCGTLFRVRVRRSEIEKYSYTCPNCGQVIIVTSRTAEKVSREEQDKNLFAIAGSFFGAFLALLVFSEFKYRSGNV